MASKISWKTITVCELCGLDGTSTLQLSLVNRDINKCAHPEAIRPLLPEIEAFAKHNHFNVLHPILRSAVFQ